MIRSDPTQRVTAEEALGHPWFKVCTIAAPLQTFNKHLPYDMGPVVLGGHPWVE